MKCKPLPLTLHLVILVFAVAHSAVAQSKPAQKPSPTPEKELLKVEPAPVRVPENPTQVQGRSQATQQPSRGEVDDKHPVITNTDLITLNVTVTDIYGRYVSGLTKRNFAVFDEKVQQNITFFSDDDAPASVGILFDLTGSMSGEKVSRAKSAIAHFIETSHEKDEYFLSTLQSGRAFLNVDRTRDARSILDKLTFVQTKGNTAFYDGVYLAAERVQRGIYPKRVVLVISDGQDNNSRYTFNDLRKALRETDVAVYAVGIEESGDSLAFSGSAILDELANISGGKSFYPRGPDEMDDIFEQIALELRHQYSIGYRPANFVTDGRWHRIKVTVSPPRGMPRLYVHSKDGYFATPSSR